MQVELIVDSKLVNQQTVQVWSIFTVINWPLACMKDKWLEVMVGCQHLGVCDPFANSDQYTLTPFWGLFIQKRCCSLSPDLLSQIRVCLINCRCIAYLCLLPGCNGVFGCERKNGQSLLIWRPGHFPFSISRDFIFVTCIDKTLICQHGGGDRKGLTGIECEAVGN